MAGKIVTVLMFFVLTGGVVFNAGDAAGEDILLIGNRSIPEAELSEEEIKAIYLGRKKLWRNSIQVVFVLSADKAVTETFLQRYVKKKPDMFQRYWRNKLFTGSGRTPPVLKSNQNIVDYIEKTKGAVGYIPAGAYSDKVKILAVFH